MLLIAAAGLAGPVLASVPRVAVATAFLAEFLSDGRYPLLSQLTDTPARRRVTVRGMEFETVGESRDRASLVLVHGFTPEGNRDRRLRRAAALLARAGFAVVLPTLPALTRGRLRPADAEPVVAALALRPPPVTLIAVSVGAGPALLAAADPRVRGRVETVLVLGGYASARELVRYFLTGTYAFGALRGQTTHDPEVVRAFIAANADLVDAPLREALERDAAGAAEQALAVLAPLLEAVSPERMAASIPGRLILVHGRGDRAVPYTESLRLADARPGDTAVVLVGVIDHVGGGGPGRLGAARDLLSLWGVTYSLIAGR